MTAGLQSWDASGALQRDLTSKLIRFVGRVDGVTTKGSVPLDLSLGKPFFFVVPLAATDSFHCPATAMVSGSTLSWTFSKIAFQEQGSPPAFVNLFTIVPSTIIYGYF